MAVQAKVKLLTDHDIPFEELVPGLQLARAITNAGSTQLGGGYMRFTQDAEFAGWTLTYDEVLFVQAGQLTVASDAGSTVARAGEAILIPKGAKVTYRGEAGTVSFFVLSRRVPILAVPDDGVGRLPSAHSRPGGPGRWRRARLVGGAASRGPRQGLGRYRWEGTADDQPAIPDR